MFVTSSMQARLPVSRTPVSRSQGNTASGLLTSDVMFSGGPDGSTTRKNKKNKQAASQPLPTVEDTLEITTRAKTPELGGEASDAELDSWERLSGSDSGEEIEPLTKEEKLEMEKQRRELKLRQWGERFEMPARALGAIETAVKNQTRQISGGVSGTISALQFNAASMASSGIKTVTSGLNTVSRRLDEYQQSGGK